MQTRHERVADIEPRFEGRKIKLHSLLYSFEYQQRAACRQLPTYVIVK